MNLNIIVAYCNKNGIGNKNTIPWKLKDDLKHFKNITTNGVGKNIVIMGRNT
jgi:dihydrofolate reductase